LKKGLMAGLGAFGGAGMAGMAGLGGSITNNAFGALSNNAGFFGANMGQGISQAGNIANLAKMGTAPVENAINVTANTGTQAGFSPTLQGALGPAPTAAGAGAGAGAGGYTGAFSNAAIPTAGLNPGQIQALAGGSIGSGTQAALTGMAQPATTGAQFTGGLGSRFGQAVRAGLPGGTPGIISKAAPMLAASGVMQGVSGAMTPSGGGSMGSDGVIDNSYAGPYYTSPRSASYRGQSAAASGDSSENLYFANSMPAVYNTQGQMVQPGSNTVRGTPILQNILNPKAKKGENRYTPTLIPYMGGVDPNEEDTDYARGGEVELSDGAFVLDRKSVV
jgi:hypothetical protein